MRLIYSNPAGGAPPEETRDKRYDDIAGIEVELINLQPRDFQARIALCTKSGAAPRASDDTFANLTISYFGQSTKPFAKTDVLSLMDLCEGPGVRFWTKKAHVAADIGKAPPETMLVEVRTLEGIILGRQRVYLHTGGTYRSHPPLDIHVEELLESNNSVSAVVAFEGRDPPARGWLMQLRFRFEQYGTIRTVNALLANPCDDGRRGAVVETEWLYSHIGRAYYKDGGTLTVITPTGLEIACVPLMQAVPSRPA